MILLGLTLLFLLQVEGIRSETFLYHRPGVEALLPCLSDLPYGTKCSFITWLNNKGGRMTTDDVKSGVINQDSVRAARLRLHSNCSLIINNVTAEDVGFYTCRLHGSNTWDTRVYLNILTISSSPPDPKRDEEVTLTCTLWRDDILLCEDGSVRWIDETGSVLDGAGDGFRFLRQTGCVSYLAVKHQSEHSRRFTCQYVKDSSVKIEDHFSTLSTVTLSPVTLTTEPSSSASGWTPLSYVMLSLRISLLVVMMVITVMVVRYPGGGKQLKPSRVRFRGNDDVQEVEYQNTGESSADSTRR